jgi:hypothetical protein
MEITIPQWMHECAPGAARAAQDIISNWPLSDVQCRRLQTLLSDKMEPAWRELAAWRGKEKPTTFEQEIAQFALFREVFLAPDRLPTDEVSQFKADLADIGRLLAQAARRFNEMMANPQTAMRTADMWWLFHRNHEASPAMADLPENVTRVPPMLELLSTFGGRAAAATNPNPETGLRKPQGEEKTRYYDVIRRIAGAASSTAHRCTVPSQRLQPAASVSTSTSTP